MNLSSHYNEESAKCFLRLRKTPNLSYLIYRDILALLKKYVTSGRALDFGCGPGISTRFFANLGFEIIGTDINKEMLKQALSEPDGIPFAWIKHGELPFADNSFDLVSSIMVLLEMPNIESMKVAVDEIHRTLKRGGIFLAVVGSEHFHKHDWFNKATIDREKYQKLTTGDEFHTYSKVTGITFKDYFYFSQDYINLFRDVGFAVVEVHQALGYEEDNMPWNLEKKLNPFTHYICEKLT